MTKAMGLGFTAAGALALLVFVLGFLGHYLIFYSDYKGFEWALGMTLMEWRSWLDLSSFLAMAGIASLTHPLAPPRKGWKRNLGLALRAASVVVLAYFAYPVLQSAYKYLTITSLYDIPTANVTYILYPGLIQAGLPPLMLWVASNLVLRRC